MSRWLMVDDDVEDQDIFSIALAEVRPEIEFLRANNGSEALQILKSSEKGQLPELIFLDVNMPHLDGKECLKELKSDPLLKNIRVIIYTTSSDARDKDELMANGASEFITKPTDINDLTKILHYISKKYSSRESS